MRAIEVESVAPTRLAPREHPLLPSKRMLLLDGLTSLSLANLLFYPVWKHVLAEELNYLEAVAPTANLLAAMWACSGLPWLSGWQDQARDTAAHRRLSGSRAGDFCWWFS